MRGLHCHPTLSQSCVARIVTYLPPALSQARVVVWREFNVPNSYTLEMSLGGGDFGEDCTTRPPIHFSMDDYLTMGRLFCEGILDLYDPGRVRLDAALLELDLLHLEVKKVPPQPAEEEEGGPSKTSRVGAVKKAGGAPSKMAGSAGTRRSRPHD